MTERDRTVTAGWGRRDRQGTVTPGRGRVEPRDWAADEAACAAHAATLCPRTNDVFLNDSAYWRNIPDRVWTFTIGGYQVLKKWLSYRERDVLGRPLSLAEIRFVRDVARRLAAICLLAPELDANYRSCAAAHRAMT